MATAERPHPLRVAIDGVDAAGKTTLAEELGPLVEARGRPVIRASLDGFHRPRSERYRRGRDSPEGYYLDSFDYEALRAGLLVPIGPEGDRRYRRAVFDFRTDTPLDEDARIAPGDAVLLFDGIFLFRPELNDLWDLRVLVAVDSEVALARALERDERLFGSEERVRHAYERRYIPGQLLYGRSVGPEELADVVVENSHLARPHLTFSARSKRSPEPVA